MKPVAALSVSIVAAVLATACGGFPPAAPGGATLTGSLASSVPGSVAARAMDDSDRRRAASALESLGNGESSSWRNRDTGDSFVFTPTRSFERGGARCREFRLEVVVGGRHDGIGGNACRQADGSWRMAA
ncbi:RT0821/Lpp0805 family surface protein [Variovorax sp. CAN2819]|uniref:RT0821/Lpp0805 family surface protein n=1 Tax=Variovorax sp. CAN15 TaxID=3046727 RepID=UPI002648F64A|nr:RT0821/Lpp0805 family surface protein [Variovorax sp. CAN15]MDN6887967.1 RT0821/Lpp0805 family surface protein [Variovorax sp. CAN15]